MRGGGAGFLGRVGFLSFGSDLRRARHQALARSHSFVIAIAHTQDTSTFHNHISTCSLCQALATPSPTARLSTCSRPSCLNLAVSLLVSCVLPRLGASLHLSLLRSTLVPRRPIITPLLARCTIDHTARPGCPASAHRRTHVRFVVARSLLFAALLLLVLLRVRLVRGIFVGIEDKVRASALLLAVL